MNFLDSCPILLVFIAIVVGTLLVGELGFLIGRRIRKEDGLDKYPIENSASSIVLGLLAFILAFSFSSVASRYKELKDIARNDTEAIEDVYMMADFLPDETAKEVRSLLHEYHRVRLDGIESRDRTKLGTAIDRAEEIQEELWPIIVEARKTNDSSILNQLVSALHEMMDSHTLRVQKGLDTRLPAALWFTTGGLLTLSSLLIGLSSGLHGKRSRMALTIVVLCFSAVLIMIIDLDRPFRTLFEKSEDSIATSLLERMEADVGK